MAYITLHDGTEVLVDDEDLPDLARYRWTATHRPNGRIYAYRQHRDEHGKYRSTYMHRQITAAPPGFDVDHVNGNTLDNTRANLRVCTRAQNIANASKTRGNSIYKGVHQLAVSGKWKASIRANGRNHHLGHFDSEVAAAQAYDEAARALHGEYAKVNFDQARGLIR